MSSTEPAVGLTDGGSSVKLVRNAKGDTQIEVKVYAGDAADDVAEAERIARQVYDRLQQQYGVAA